MSTLIMFCCYTVVMSFIFYLLDSYCEKLSPPENGAITCESWRAGLMCTVHCNEGYDMAFRPRPWYYCESDGNWRKGNTKWSKKPTVPECSGTKIAQATASSMTISSSGALSLMPYATEGSSGFLRGLHHAKWRLHRRENETPLCCYEFNIFRTICY